MRTTMRSESTLVPPVTDERSPPDSRMTGADSPVMADSSTEAMPSMISPSPGMSWPASTTTRSPLRSCDAGTASSAARPSTSRRAVVSWRILRSVAACALPRPSATASAKLAKSTVNHSQTVTVAENQSGACPAAWCDDVAHEERRRQHAADLDDEHDRVLRQQARVQLAEAVDDRPAAGSTDRTARVCLGVAISTPSPHARRSARRWGRATAPGRRSGADDDDDADEQRGEQDAVGGEGAGPGGTVFLLSIEPAMARTGTIMRKRPTSMVDAERDVPPGRVGVEPGEGRAVVAGAADVGVEDLADRPCGPPLFSDETP